MKVGVVVILYMAAAIIGSANAEVSEEKVSEITI
jgi:hypothetical protein